MIETPGDIDRVLSDGDLQQLRKGYDGADMTHILSTGIPRLDKHTTKYIHSIRRAFYDGTRMLPKDRERCLIGILSSRDSGLNLAIHIYVGLMEGLSPDEISDVIFLGGVYTGVDRLSDGLAAEVRALTVLKHVVGSGSCAALDVMKALKAAFTPPPPTPK